MHRLLGLDRFSSLEKDFRFTRERERELQLAKRRLDMARANEEWGQAHTEEVETGERIHAAQLVAYATNADKCEHVIATTAQQVGELETREKEIRDRLRRCTAIQEAMALTDRVPGLLEDVKRAREHLGQAHTMMVEFDRIQREELPAMRARIKQVRDVLTAIAVVETTDMDLTQALNSLRAVQARVDAAERAREEESNRVRALATVQARLEHRNVDRAARVDRDTERISMADDRYDRLTAAAKLVRVWEGAIEALKSARDELATVESRAAYLMECHEVVEQRAYAHEQARLAAVTAAQAAQQAQATAEKARVRDALASWIRLARTSASMVDLTERRLAVENDRTAAHENYAHARQARRRPQRIAIGAGVLAAVGAAFGFVWHPAFVPAVVALCVGAAYLIRCQRAMAALTAAAQKMAEIDAQERDLEVEQRAANIASSDQSALPHHEHTLRDLGVPIPASIEAAEAAMAALNAAGMSDGQNAHDIARDAALEAGRFAESATQAREKLADAQAIEERARDAAAHDGRVASVERITAAQRHMELALRNAQTATSRDLTWPVSSQDIAVALAGCSAEQETARTRLNEGEVESAALVVEAENEVRQAAESLAEAQAALATACAAVVDGEVERASVAVATARDALDQVTSNVALVATSAEVSAERGAVEAERGRIEERISTLEAKLADRATVKQTIDSQEAAMADAFAKAVKAVGAMCEALATVGLAPLGRRAADTGNDALDQASVPETTEAHITELRMTLLNAGRDELKTLNAPQLQKTLEDILQESAVLNRRGMDLWETLNDIIAKMREILLARGFALPDTHSRSAIGAVWTLTMAVDPQEIPTLTERHTRAQQKLYAARQRIEALRAELGYPDDMPGIDDCQQRVDSLLEERQIGERAQSIIRETRDRIARHVLPTTERNMQLLLPQLTSRRYRDVRLTAPDTEDGKPGEVDYRIRVWDPRASRYFSKNVFSGGTRDQCSLALRLAFALATLPQELGVAPGFMFLDEPLSAFDSRRAQDLVTLLTSGTISEQFAQVIVISHSHAFERDAFRYRVLMNDGRVQESTLPVPINETATSTLGTPALAIVRA